MMKGGPPDKILIFDLDMTITSECFSDPENINEDIKENAQYKFISKMITYAYQRKWGVYVVTARQYNDDLYSIDFKRMKNLMKSNIDKDLFKTLIGFNYLVAKTTLYPSFNVEKFKTLSTVEKINAIDEFIPLKVKVDDIDLKMKIDNIHLKDNLYSVLNTLFFYTKFYCYCGDKTVVENIIDKIPDDIDRHKRYFLEILNEMAYTRKIDNEPFIFGPDDNRVVTTETKIDTNKLKVSTKFGEALATALLSTTDKPLGPDTKLDPTVGPTVGPNIVKLSELTNEQYTKLYNMYNVKSVLNVSFTKMEQIRKIKEINGTDWNNVFFFDDALYNLSAFRIYSNLYHPEMKNMNFMGGKNKCVFDEKVMDLVSNKIYNSRKLAIFDSDVINSKNIKLIREIKSYFESREWLIFELSGVNIQPNDDGVNTLIFEPRKVANEPATEKIDVDYFDEVDESTDESTDESIDDTYIKYYNISFIIRKNKVRHTNVFLFSSNLKLLNYVSNDFKGVNIFSNNIEACSFNRLTRHSVCMHGGMVSDNYCCKIVTK